MKNKILFIFCLFLFLAFLFNHGFAPSLTRPKDLYGERAGNIISSTDKDGDGTDDQTDILNGALSYIKTRPLYKSKYYAGGYPDDGYGVCTDLVAAALKSAGYDLRELVNEDILEYPWDYEIETPDKDIDYRRVKNLRIYFYHHGITKSLDIYDAAQWSGGDIVIFDEHIGIVSDRRNEKGVSYVIHHNGAFQKAFEEDILESRQDLVAHYRISE